MAMKRILILTAIELCCGCIGSVASYQYSSSSFGNSVSQWSDGKQNCVTVNGQTQCTAVAAGDSQGLNTQSWSDGKKSCTCVNGHCKCVPLRGSPNSNFFSSSQSSTGPVVGPNSFSYQGQAFGTPQMPQMAPMQPLQFSPMAPMRPMKFAPMRPWAFQPFAGFSRHRSVGDRKQTDDQADEASMLATGAERKPVRTASKRVM